MSGDVVVPVIKANELKIGPEIGRGAFGSVYRGTCRGKEVVIKILEGIEWSEEVKAEFLSEINIMAQLLHGNIVLCMGTVTDLPNYGYGIVLEFMSRGTLHKILHDPKISISLPRQIQFGIDTCQGMAWLHGQKIWHRDLKPENVLLDDNWVGKVADFGLSEINRQRAKKRDKDDAPGSVLWMAPEVLLSEDLDNKLDVYAFALVFWETLTRKDLFSQYTDRDLFTEDIARKGIRPPTDDIHPILRDILVRSWHHKPDNRPSFVELIDLLRKAMVDIFLPASLCPDAGKWWMKNWNGKSKVPYKSFCEAFGKEFKKLTSTQMLCMTRLFTEEVNKEVLVDIEKFGNGLKWFGKIRQDTQTIANRVEDVMKQPWFFGDIDTIEAQEKVEMHKATPGTFLVRLNLGGSAKVEDAPYTITSSSVKGSYHTRCYTRQEKVGFIVQIKKGEEKVNKVASNSSLIEDLIRKLCELKDICVTPVPGHPYARIFSERVEKSGYDIADGDD